MQRDLRPHRPRHYATLQLVPPRLIACNSAFYTHIFGATVYTNLFPANAVYAYLMAVFSSK